MTTFLGAAGFLRGAFPLAGLLRGGDGVVDASRRMTRLPAMVLMLDGEVPSDLSVFLPSDRVLRGLSVMVSGLLSKVIQRVHGCNICVLVLPIYHGISNLQDSGLPCGPGCSRFRYRCILSGTSPCTSLTPPKVPATHALFPRYRLALGHQTCFQQDWWQWFVLVGVLPRLSQ